MREYRVHKKLYKIKSNPILISDFPLTTYRNPDINFP